MPLKSGAIDGRGRDGLAPDDPDDSVFLSSSFFLSSDLASSDPSSSSGAIDGRGRDGLAPDDSVFLSSSFFLSSTLASSDPSSSFFLSSSFLLVRLVRGISEEPAQQADVERFMAVQHALRHSPSYVGELGWSREWNPPHDDLQYLDSIKSSTQDLSLPLDEIIIYPMAFSGDRGWYALEPKLICWHVAMRAVGNTAYPAWIPT